MMKRFLWSLSAAAILAAAPSFTLAQATQKGVVEEQVAVDEPAEVEQPADDPNTGALTFTGGLDWTTAYFFRGYNQEDQGLILQPYFNISTPIIAKDEYTLNGYIGTWNSFQSEKTLAAATGPDTWYESDLYGGLDFIYGKWTLGAIYTFYTYPNGAFNNIQELGFKVAYDDTEFMKDKKVPFALKPYVGIYFETKDDNGTEDTYLEAGVTPSFALGESNWTLSVPVVIGMSVDDFYLDSGGDNEFLGYTSVGAFFSTPIKLPAKYGAWTFTAGVQWLQLYADSVEAVNSGDDTQFIGKVGVSFAY